MNYFDPWASVIRGQQAEQNIATAAQEGQARRDFLAAREALAMVGQGENLTGYEDMPGAVRPEYVRRLYATNPDLAYPTLLPPRCHAEPGSNDSRIRRTCSGSTTRAVDAVRRRERFRRP